MKRRDILKYTAYITGAAVSAPLASSLLSGCQPSASTNTSSQHFFSNEDFSLLKELVDTILPKTDTPSASEVGVHDIIDNMVGRVYSDGDKTAYAEGFSALSTYIKGGGEKLASLINLEEGGAQEDVRSAYRTLKQQTIAYYLSTEEIATNYLNYLPVPGEYKACITLEEVDGKAWAL